MTEDTQASEEGEAVWLGDSSSLNDKAKLAFTSASVLAAALGTFASAVSRDQMTEEQRNRLEDLIVHLCTFPLPELIVASGDLRCPRPLNEQAKQRVRQSLAGAYAIGKIANYMHMLRGVDAERQRVGHQAHLLRQRVQKLGESNPESAITADVHVSFLSGMQEVTYHFFAICVMAIDGLLPLVARATGYKIPPADKAVLAAYKPLRDYFEHIEDRAPGKSRQAEVVTEHQDEHQWRVVHGFLVDEDDRIILNDQPVDVTMRGLHVVEEVVARSYLGMKASCLNQVRDHFAHEPSTLPSPDDVPYKPLVSVFCASDESG